MDSRLRTYESTANWLADARSVFASRILEAVTDASSTDGPEALLGCVPAAQAEALIGSIQTGRQPRTDSADIAAAANRLAEPDAVAGLPVGRLLEAFGLSEQLAPWCALLLLAEHDSRFSPLFAYLNDDAQRRWLTAAVAERLAGPLPEPMHDLLAEGAPLRASLLVEFPESLGSALPDRPVRWQDPIARWLLGDNQFPATDSALSGYLRWSPTASLEMLFDEAICQQLRASADEPLLVLIGDPGSGRALTAQGLASIAKRGTLIVTGAELATNLEWETQLRRALRDATLRGDTLVLTEADRLPRPGLAAAIQGSPCPVMMTAERRLEFECPQIGVPPLDDKRSRLVWRAALGDPRVDIADQLAHRFRLPADDILRIAEAASPQADRHELSAACLDRSARTLDQLANRVAARHDWSDLILPARQKAQLRCIEARVAQARTVFNEWGFGHKLAPNQGLTALFSGPSGSGKTLSAGIIAAAVGLPLYRVDLSSTVSKYIGETEKNLEAIFSAAEAGNACLFFDECDALFGKRSEVSDAHDRYANIETSYLLQRLETHRGIVMMASNYPQNIDEAFSRRIDITVEFPMPDGAQRAELWRTLTPPEAKADIDFAALGDRFGLPGGSIRNCLLTAAFLAAVEGQRIRTDHCVRAVAEEYRKTGKPLTRAEFGDAFASLRSTGGG